MTEKELKSILKSMINNDWIEFEDESDKEYILSLIKEDSWEDILSAMETCVITKNREDWEQLSQEDY